MTDTKNQGDKTLHVSSKTLSLKRPVEQGVVRQSFSHGRSKAVVVETVKRRPAVGPGSGVKDERPAPQQAAAPANAPKPAAPAPKPAAPAQGGRPQRSAPNTPRSGGMVLQTLSEQERDARMNALVDARRRDEEDRKRQAEEAARKARAIQLDPDSIADVFNVVPFTPGVVSRVIDLSVQDGRLPECDHAAQAGLEDDERLIRKYDGN